MNRVLLGLASLFSSTTTPVKRSTARAGFVVKQAPATGRKFTGLVVNRQAKHNPAKTLTAARLVAVRAQRVGAAALAHVAKATRPTALHGTAPIVARRLGLGELKVLAKKTIADGKKLAATADKFQKVIAADVAKERAGTARSQAVTKLRGVGTSVLGALLSRRRHVLGDDTTLAPPDPNNPGYLTDGSVDPNYAPASSAAVAGPPDFGAGAPPTLASFAPQPGLDYAPDPYPNGDDPTFYDCPTDDDLPLGAIVYDGSRQPPFQGLGNFAVFFGMLPDSGPPKGGPSSGYSFHGDDGWWLLLQGTQPSVNYSGGKNYDHVNNPDAAMVGESMRNNWGPLMGNPGAGWTRGLRFSPSGPNGPRWFWYFDTAQQVAPWAVQALLQARLNEAIVAYQAAVTAGQTDYVNAQIQDKLDAKTAADQARAQAAQDAQLQLQQQRQDAQQAAFDQQQGQAGAALEAQQAAIDARTDAAQAAYFEAHPDAMFAPASSGGGYGDDANTADDPFGDGVDAGVDWGDDEG